MSLAKKLLRNTLWNAAETVLDSIIPPIVGALVARQLGPTKLGGYSYVMWIASLAVMFGGFGAGSAVQKFLGDSLGRGNFEQGRALVFRAFALQGVVALLVVGGASIWVLSLPTEQRIYASIAVFSVFPMALMSIATAVNSAMENLSLNVKASLVGLFVQNALTLLSLAFDWDMVGLASALCIGRWLDCLLRLRFASVHFGRFAAEHGVSLEKRTATLDKVMSANLFRFCLQATGLMLLNLCVWNRSEILFLEKLCDVRQIAYFSVAYGFSSLPANLTLPFARAAVSSLYAERGRDAGRGLAVAQWLLRYQILLILPASAGLAALAGPLVRVFYGEQYLPSIEVFVVAVLLGSAAPLGRPAVDLLTAADLQRPLLWWTAAASVVVLGLDWILVSWFCAVGGAWANGLGQMVFTIGLWVIGSRILGLRIPLGFSSKVLVVSAAMGMLVWVSSLHVPPLIALVTGPFIGAIVYVVGLRLLRVLEDDDRERVVAFAKLLPGRMRGPAHRVLEWLIP